MKWKQQFVPDLGRWIISFVFNLAWLVGTVAAAAVPLVEDGEARAVLVLATEPTPTTEYAAGELAYHVERATGVRLLTVTEDDIPETYPARVYIGDTRAARQAGIEIDRLGADVFVLKTSGHRLFIAGRENPEADPLDQGLDLNPNPDGGPLFGVYEILERNLGVRWLWPGELGTVVEPADRVVIAEIDEQIAPAIAFRLYRYQHLVRAARQWPGREEQTVRRLAGYTAAGIEESVDQLLVFLRRHRLGVSEPVVRGGHGIRPNVPGPRISWSDHGREHPDWFGMDNRGRRGFGDPADSRKVPYCVSNPVLHQAILDQWDGEGWIELGEVDTARYCQCPDCIAWDASQDKPPGDRGYIVSDRYARFWKTIYEQAAKRNPEVRIAVLVYVNYFPAPLREIELNENILAQFCPWGWLRQNPEKQWQGWRETGIQLTWRPNDWCYHYVMPMPGTVHGGAGKFFQFAREHGMYAFDYDSLQPHWVSRNPTLYMHMRWASNPDLAVAEILEEYYAAFGPAADQIARYVEYWENYEYPPGGGRPNFMAMRNVHLSFPAKAFDQADRILEEALEAAQAADRSEYAERVEFLIAGIRHARLSSELWSTLDDPPRGERGQRAPTGGDAYEIAVQALHRLLDFRRANQTRHIADFWGAAINENRNIPNIGILLDGFEQ